MAAFSFRNSIITESKSQQVYPLDVFLFFFPNLFLWCPSNHKEITDENEFLRT